MYEHFVEGLAQESKRCYWQTGLMVGCNGPRNVETRETADPWCCRAFSTSANISQSSKKLCMYGYLTGRVWYSLLEIGSCGRYHGAFGKVEGRRQCPAERRETFFLLIYCFVTPSPRDKQSATVEKKERLHG